MMDSHSTKKLVLASLTDKPRSSAYQGESTIQSQDLVALVKKLKTLSITMVLELVAELKKP